MEDPTLLPTSSRALATDRDRLEQLFGRSDLVPLWIAEPYLPIAQPIRAAIEERAKSGWYGYESRPGQIKDAFWEWMESRHGWSRDGLTTIVSPSVGSSIGVLINELTDEGDGVLIQPPVFTDFKPLIVTSNRTVVRNPLVLDGDDYTMDLEGLRATAAKESTRLMILCSPHNPIGRVWSDSELTAVARICADNDVIVLADEIHADLTLPPNTFVPFATVAADSGVKWAATHGPIKTFGLAGVCDTLLVTDNEPIAGRFKDISNRLHLTRNNVFALAAFEAAYREGSEWLDGLLALIESNVERLADGLNGGVRAMPHQATYLAWLDFRELGLEVPELAKWLAESGLALSPGHWFGRQGAGFARMSMAVDSDVIDEAIRRLNRA
ncbi:MAG: aminotransferase class I/II-fold pyridoxal phosphate-dependent enzyme [Acidimicrobiia bacterium]|nr:aminotransferase class I/II-fold pyridoxal phosphate-dependent enzyme [Acidimicrobiia bacterium]